MKKSNPKILFYTNIPRSFRTTLIGYLYEIAQVYPTVLLSEKLDYETEKIIADKRLFPKLEKIISINQFSAEKRGLLNLLARHRHFSKLAKDLIQRYKPDIVFATGSEIFESYLRRFAKKSGIITISGIGPLFVQIKDIEILRDLWGGYSRFPSFLPRNIKIMLVRCRRYLAHFMYFWILPILAGQAPFTKEPSCILWDVENVNGADFYFVFSKIDYDILTDNGVPKDKLSILVHPLQGKGREIFKIAYPSRVKQKNKDIHKILTIMYPENQIGFKRDDYSLIPKEKMQEDRTRIISLIADIFKDWKIFIKPHPMIKDNPAQLQEIIEAIEPISKSIKVTDPLEPADEYIEASDAIAVFPPVSTTLFTSFLQCPEKPILSLDLLHELLGDGYKNSEGIEYIDSQKKLINVLQLIRDNKYYKKHETNQETKGYLGIVDMLKDLC